MGKFLYYVVILTFMNLMFFIFLQPADMSLLGIIWSIIFGIAGGGGWSELTASLSSGLFNLTTALAAVASIAGIALATVTRGAINLETFIWTSIAVTFLINLGVDFIIIFRMLAIVKPPLTIILALIFTAPYAVLFVFTILEWIRGKD